MSVYVSPTNRSTSFEPHPRSSMWATSALTTLHRSPSSRSDQLRQCSSTFRSTPSSSRKAMHASSFPLRRGIHGSVAYWSSLYAGLVSRRADDGDGRKVFVRRIQGLRDRVGTAGAARDIGARSLEVRVEHEDPVLGFRESEEVASQHLRNLAFRRHVMVRDHGVQAVERVHHSRSEVDEPDERSAPPF